MKNLDCFKWFGGFFVRFCMCVLLTGCVTQTHEISTVKSAVVKNSFNGLQLEARIPEKCKLNEKIPFGVTLTSMRSYAISWSESADPDPFTVEIKTKGDLLQPINQREWDDNRFVLLTLSAGESIHREIDLAKFYKFKPGVYYVNIGLGIIATNKNFEINNLDPLKFEIVN